MFGQDDLIRKEMDSLGVHTHEYRDDIFKGKVVASWCNGSFLEKLPKIMESGKPESVVWSNTMTWLFPLEIKAQQSGWIDHHCYVSKFQQGYIQDQLTEKSGRVVVPLDGYRPYFEVSDEFKLERNPDYFCVGRLSRNDPNKFAKDMWKMFDDILSPNPKKVFIQAWSPQVQNRVGNPPAGLDWMTTGPNEIKVREFYHMLHCILHKTGGSRESYCRIVPECYAHGTVMIAENDFAFPELIIDGHTGFLCDSTEEMSFRASEMAAYPKERNRIAKNAYTYLKHELMNPDLCAKPWLDILS